MSLVSVQNTLADASLTEFDRPIGVSIVPQGQDWKDRQKIQYEAIKGLMFKDFHGLQDFYEQMFIYSSTNPLILGPAWRAIQPLAPRNRNVLATLTDLPGLGLVGQYLATLVGFEQTFVLPNEILEDSAALKDALGV